MVLAFSLETFKQMISMNKQICKNKILYKSFIMIILYPAFLSINKKKSYFAKTLVIQWI